MRILLIFLFLFAAGWITAQEKKISPTFRFISTPPQEDIIAYFNALQQADLSNYRLSNKRVSISFNNGITVELFSANELIEMGLKINPDDFQPEYPEGFILPEFSLATNGYIIATYPARIKK